MNHPESTSIRARFRVCTLVGVGILLAASATGCELQQRRVDVPTASGADETLEDRFGLTDDAQDPTERDKELGYGKWKAKPEPEGTADPTHPSRRRWGGSPQ
ncbi:MAG: hypothetical protein WD114_03490 [Phycisphaerales bacterium]